MNRLTKRAIYSITVIVACNSAQADEIADHIYWIKARFADGTNAELTGFKVKGRSGIFTALHGVVGASRISAYAPAVEDATPIEFRIQQVDLDRDVAVLTPADAKTRLPTGGLALGLAPDLTALAGVDVDVFGFPLGVNLIVSRTPLTIRKPPMRLLSEVLNVTARKALGDRNSPAIDISVLGIEGNLLPGHSGAPILDADAAVIAIGNGGLDLGRVGWGWAIPFHDVMPVAVQQSPQLQERLTKLAAMPVRFSYTCILDDSVRTRMAELGVSVRTIIASPDGTGVLAITKTPKESMKDQFARLDEVLKMFREGKELDPVKELERLNQKLTPLTDGTLVEVLDIERPENPRKAPPAFPIIPLPSNGDKGNPFDALAGALGDVAQEINVKIKVLDGPNKDKVLWVARSALKRETVVTAE